MTTSVPVTNPFPYPLAQIVPETDQGWLQSCVHVPLIAEKCAVAGGAVGGTGVHVGSGAGGRCVGGRMMGGRSVGNGVSVGGRVLVGMGVSVGILVAVGVAVLVDVGVGVFVAVGVQVAGSE